MSPESSGSGRTRRFAALVRAVAAAAPRLRRWRRTIGFGLLVAALLLPVSVVGSVVWVRRSAQNHVFAVADVPAAPVALVLGAQVYPDGTPSPFLAARLGLAKELLDAGKVRALLVSGDHGRWEYDEPGAMSRWLVERGVPAGKVVQDHAGFDTYDSCSRARRVFGVDRAIVVTQSFHVERAVTVCRRVGLDAVGVGDDSVRRFERAWRWGGFRENFAAVKAVYDVVTGRDPVFLGPAEPGVRDALAG
ncbi:membrane protein [Plantactinospora endophytica]|uniref:Membrane protein n=1 Tax=Plantactinospora endophytica TaxID=673535 RepID=A0ABQ4DYX6_9ACTN|nr:membrane protein [Plantactinospora endophytica]